MSWLLLAQFWVCLLVLSIRYCRLRWAESPKTWLHGCRCSRGSFIGNNSFACLFTIHESSIWVFRSSTIGKVPTSQHPPPTMRTMHRHPRICLIDEEDFADLFSIDEWSGLLLLPAALVVPKRKKEKESVVVVVFRWPDPSYSFSCSGSTPPLDPQRPALGHYLVSRPLHRCSTLAVEPAEASCCCHHCSCQPERVPFSSASSCRFSSSSLLLCPCCGFGRYYPHHFGSSSPMRYPMMRSWT